jgi:hypothetical protein
MREEGEVLLAFTNNGGSSTRRIYEMHTGRQFGDVLMREGNYRQAFPEDLTESALRLNGHWDEKEMDEWGNSEMQKDPSNSVSRSAAERSAGIAINTSASTKPIRAWRGLPFSAFRKHSARTGYAGGPTLPFSITTTRFTSLTICRFEPGLRGRQRTGPFGVRNSRTGIPSRGSRMLSIAKSSG